VLPQRIIIGNIIFGKNAKADFFAYYTLVALLYCYYQERR